MSVLGDVRELIADAINIETTAKVVSFVPERIVPPMVIVTSGSPYVESGNTFGTFKTRFSVEIVSPTAANSTSTEKLDVLIEDCLVALSNSSGLSIEAVSKPYALEANNATYLAASLSVTHNTAI